MRSIAGGVKLRDAGKSNTFFAMLAMTLITLVLLWASPAWAQATQPNLSITKDGPTRVEPGETFDYVLRVSNAAGAEDAEVVVIRDNLPDGVEFDSSNRPCPQPVGNTVNCTLGPLAAGDSQNIRLTVRRDMPGVITNRATARANDNPGADPDATSNAVTTRVIPNLVINKRDRPDPVNREGLLQYTITVENQGNTNPEDVRIRDELPLDEVDFIRVESEDFTCEESDGIVRCRIDASLVPDDVALVRIFVEPNEAGTIENTAEVFVGDRRVFVDRDTEETTVRVNAAPDPDDPDDPNNPGGPNNPGTDLPQGDQCSPVVRRGTEDPIGVISGSTDSNLTFTNTFNQTLPLRIVYATSSEDGSLKITVTPQDRGDAILDETIEGKKRGVLEMDTESGATYNVEILPEDQGFAVLFEIDRGSEACTDPESLDPDVASSSNDPQDDVVDGTVPDDDLPDTGGVPISVLAGCAALLLAGTAVVVATARRKQ